jgi:hypothetical protein
VTRTTQSKVRDLIEFEANMYDLELIDDPKFSNTGMWRIQSKDSLRDKVAIKYDFQSGYCSLTVVGVAPVDGPSIIGSGYIDSDKTLTMVVARIQKHIREHRR